MIRRISFTRRADGVGYEDFQRHWRGPHAELARLLPDLRSYVQNHAVLGSDGPLLPYPGFDVCVELQYDSREDMEASLTSPEYRGAAVADQAGFTDMSHLMSMLVDSPGVPPDSPGREPIKHMTFIRRTAAVEPARFADAEAAVAFTTSAAAQRARWELGGLAAGVERLIARGLRII